MSARNPSATREASDRRNAGSLLSSGVKAYALVKRGSDTESVPISMEPPDDPFQNMYLGQRLNGENDGSDTSFVVPRQPAVDFVDLNRIYQGSCILPQCGDAVAQFVEGQGFELLPVEGVKVDKLQRAEKIEARREKRITEAFLKTAASTGGQPCRWTRMLVDSRQDFEPMGWRAFEVLCSPTMPDADPLIVDPLGTPVGLNHLEVANLRWCEGIANIQVTEYANELQYDDEDDESDDDELQPTPEFKPRLAFRQFRMLVYWRDSNMVPSYFRQFGDPRIIHSASGAVLGRYDRGRDINGRIVAPLPGEEPWRVLLNDESRGMPAEDVGPAVWANEALVQIRYASTWSPYGKPWWYGVSTVSEGLAAAEEANYSAIHSPKIPRVIITSEGVQTTGDSERLQDQIDQRDDPAAHSEILLIENKPHVLGDISTGDVKSQRSMINVHQISGLPDGGLFVEFDNQGRTKVRSARGLSSMSVGLSDEYTFASARAALMVEDPRVYRPEREELDNLMSRILDRRRVKWWRYATKHAQIVSPDEASKVIEQAELGGALTPNIHRELLSTSLGIQQPPISEPWGDQPFELTKAASTSLGGPAPGGQSAQKGEAHPVTQAMVNLRSALVSMRQSGGGGDQG